MAKYMLVVIVGNILFEKCVVVMMYYINTVT